MVSEHDGAALSRDDLVGHFLRRENGAQQPWPCPACRARSLGPARIIAGRNWAERTCAQCGYIEGKRIATPFQWHAFTVSDSLPPPCAPDCRICTLNRA